MIEALPQPGGQQITLYPEKIIYDVPVFPEVSAKELAARLYEQARRWKPSMALGEQALTLKRVTVGKCDDREEVWDIGTDKGEHRSRTVIIAAGIGAFLPVKLENESVMRLDGRGVDYMVSDYTDCAGKRVMIIGGGDSAVDWAPR